MSAVNALRAKYDPRSSAIIGAHITMTVPFPRPATGARWTELEGLAAEIAPVEIRYGPVRHYLPHPGVCLAIEPQAELERLLVHLEASSAFEGAKPRPYPFSAHMTIAEFITVERTESLMVELKDVAPNGSFMCSHVSYAVPDSEFHFAERGRLELGCR
jgi:2'-5' RNA ligase